MIDLRTAFRRCCAPRQSRGLLIRAAAAAGVLAVLGVLGAACSGDAPPRARAQRIGALEDAIGGPHAIGRIGDFLLENDQIRLVIADTGVSADPDKTTYGRVNTTYGGSLVDADLVRPGGGGGRGNDQLAELLPGFAFSVINPTQVCVPNRLGACPRAPGEALRDGSDGGPAEVLVTGGGADLLQMVALLNTALLYPPNLRMQTVYRLHPGKKYVEIETTLTNTSSGAHPLPYLDPTQLDDLVGGDLPGIGTIQLSVPLGMLPLLGGEQELFAPGVAGFNVKYAIEDSYLIAGGFPAFPGLAVDFLASRGDGVSYALTVPASPDNYVNAYADGYPGQDLTPHSMLLPFTYAGVAGVYMAKPPALLQPNEQFTYTAYFVVGAGDVGSLLDTIYELRGTPTGTFGGRVVDAQTGAPVARAHVLVLDARGRPIDQLETDAGGAFLGKLAPGSYSYRVLTDDREPTAPRPIEITAGAQTGAFVELPAPATLIVAVLDERGRNAPAKIQLIGTYAGATDRDPRSFLYSLPLGERERPTAFDGTPRFVEAAWWTADGRVQAPVRPGTYELVVSRGPEYEVTRVPVTLRAGAYHSEQLRLVRAFPTDGWIAGDFHLHARPSTDSGLPIAERVRSCAAEGLEVAVATDHNFITDYAPEIAANGLDAWLLGIPGMELTTFEMGHFNGYPLRVDPGSTRGGEFVWAHRSPQQLFDQLRALAIDPASAIVQVNHPRQQVLGYFAQFFIDAATAEPYTPAGILGVFAPYGEEFAADKYSHDFDALELITGRRIEDVHTLRAPSPLPPGPHPDPQPVPGEIVVGPDGRPKFPGVVETWFTMLDRGHRATGLGTSDTHTTLGHEPGYARTLLFVGAGKDEPGAYGRDDVIRAIRAHRAITTNAPFLELTTSGGGMIGDTVTGASHDVIVRVRAPQWAKVDRLIVYSNSAVIADVAIPAAQGTDFEHRLTVRPAADAWVVAEATGTANMFPVLSPTEFPPLDATVIIQALSVGLDLSSLPLASNLKPERTHTSTPYAITNPIWIDVAGDGWTPPRPPLPRRGTARAAPLPDVRAQFEALPEVSP